MNLRTLTTGTRRLLLNRARAKRSGRVASHSAQTLVPLGLPIEYDDRLAENAPADGARELLDSLEDAVAGTHGDVVLNLFSTAREQSGAVVSRLKQPALRDA
jgi:hypothetical protein